MHIVLTMCETYQQIPYIIYPCNKYSICSKLHDVLDILCVLKNIINFIYAINMSK